ncbi:phage Gp19/Gp15/Gp42 family protein [Helcococcus kunzii]|uniref:phage Gp19/Gp15/Gp42 family protein n=1 Tax=Helcococcus kunzii TaxID=40091 RepID=UPI00389B9250
MAYATIEDLENLWRELRESEVNRAENLLTIVSDTLDYEAEKAGRNLSEMIEKRPSFKSVVKSVVVDIVARTLMTSTENEPMSQVTQSALGYTMTGTFLVPGGGLFIKNSELSRLGLKRQRYGGIELYDINKRSDCNFNSEDKNRI